MGPPQQGQGSRRVSGTGSPSALEGTVGLAVPSMARIFAMLALRPALVERWLLARLRKRQFFSLAEVNAAIALLLAVLNDKVIPTAPGVDRSACISRHS